jgi:NAD(P)-dependent dehydrogenase (short-subunit alcohol dehydrogenase family)
MFDFTAKSIVVTGGTSGIGRAIVRAFSEAGA